MDQLDKNKSILHASVAGHITTIHPPPPGVSGMVSSDPGAVKPDLPNVLLKYMWLLLLCYVASHKRKRTRE